MIIGFLDQSPESINFFKLLVCVRAHTRAGEAIFVQIGAEIFSEM